MPIEIPLKWSDEFRRLTESRWAEMVAFDLADWSIIETPDETYITIARAPITVLEPPDPFSPLTLTVHIVFTLDQEGLIEGRLRAKVEGTVEVKAPRDREHAPVRTEDGSDIHRFEYKLGSVRDLYPGQLMASISPALFNAIGAAGEIAPTYYAQLGVYPPT